MTPGWRDLTTRELLEENEHWRWLWAEFASDPATKYPAESIAYCRQLLAGIEAELARRQRLRQRPEAPAWPEPSDRRAEVTAIKARLSVADFLTTYTVADLQRRGDRFVTRCVLPGHEDDATPSLVIYPGDRGWYCFGCQRGGDVFDLARIVLGIERFGDVVNLLAAATGIARAKQDEGFSTHFPLGGEILWKTSPTTVQVAGQRLTIRGGS